MSVQERLREAYERTRSSGPAEAGAYERFLRRRARSVRTVAAAAVVLVLAMAGLAPRPLGGPDRGVVRPPRPAPQPVPPAPPLMLRLTADGPQIRAVAFSPDGQTLAVAGRHRISLWNLDRGTRTVLDTPESPNLGEAVAFAPDGRTLAAAAGARVVLWDLASRTRRASLPLPTGMAGSLGPLAFSPDGRVLAAVGDGEILLAWDVARRAQLAIVPTGVSGITDLAFRPNSRIFRPNSRIAVVAGLASGGGAYRRGDPVPVNAVIVDVSGRSTHPPVRMQAGLGSQPAVAFRRDGSALAAVGDPQQRLAVWNLFPEAHLHTLAGRYPVTGVVLSRDGSLLAMASPGGEVTVWDFGRGVLRGPLPGFHPRRAEFSLSPRNAAFSGDGRRLAIADGSGSVFVWSTANP
jgi:WD40 repeat protein